MPSISGSTNGHSGPNGRAASSHPSILYDEGPQRSSQIHKVIEILWKRKWVLMIIVGLAVAGTAAYTYSIPTTYRTSTLLLVDRQAQRGVIGQLSTSQLGYNSQSRTVQNELLVLQQSMTIPTRVAERLLDMETHPGSKRPISVLTTEMGDSLGHQRLAYRIRGMVRAGTYGSEVDAIRILSTGRDAYDVGLVANLYAEEYIERTKEKSRESLSASRHFLETQAEKLKTEVESAENQIEEYMTREGAVSLDQESSRIVGEIADLEARRREMQIERQMLASSIRMLETELEEAESRLTENVSNTTQQRLQTVQDEKARLEVRIEQIERQNPDLPAGGTLRRDLRDMKERVRVLEARADSLAREYVAGRLESGVASMEEGDSSVSFVAGKRSELARKRIDLQGVESRLDALNEQLMERRSTLRSIPEQSMELAQLQRERRSTERIYGYVQEKLQETRLAMESEMGYAEIIRSAGPGGPISPNMNRNLLLALLFGLSLGGGLVFLYEKLDTRIQQPDDLHDHGHRIVGVVPSMNHLIDTEFDGQESVHVDGRDVSTALAMLVSPMSAIAESYRRIRTNLQFARPDKTVSSIAVSSADKGEGKSTTSSNLAIALASASKKTLLVDADLRRPRAHTLLGLDREPGLSQLLYNDDIDIDAFKTDVDSLWVLPAGETVPNPAELLGSQRMRDLIDDLKERFDYIIFDTPPVMLFSDALGLASRCDGTLLVASANSTDGRAFDHAVSLLDDVEADFLGCVLNRYDSGSFLQGYGYNYGYAHSYKRLAEHYAEENTAGGLLSWLKRG
jgi:capsular exopolysaccharide synthesis family protein